MNSNRIRPLMASIDDAKGMREIIVALGGMAGFDCIEASGPKEIAVALDQDPDLIVLDMTMPDMDGFEVIWELGRRQSTARLIILSGFEPKVVRAAETIAQKSKLNVLARLEKPIDSPRLLKLLQAAYRDLIPTDASLVA
jgi:CheY-like chemotaxis protein